MAQGLSTPDPSLSPTHLSIRRGRAITTHVPSLGLRIGPVCEAGLSVGMRRERVPPERIKIKIYSPMKTEDTKALRRQLHHV